MSTRYIAAAQILDRSVFIDQFSSSNLNRDSIWDLVDHVSCTWNPDFGGKGAWYTGVSVVFEDGETVVSEIAAAESLACLMSEERIKEKSYAACSVDHGGIINKQIERRYIGSMRAGVQEQIDGGANSV